jgi:predicted DNA-binding ribbon-helix-helix protein
MHVLRALGIIYDPRHPGPMPTGPRHLEEREAQRRWVKAVTIRREEQTWIQIIDGAADRQRADLARQMQRLDEARTLHSNFLSIARRYAFRWRIVGKPVQLAVRWKQKVHGVAPNLSLIG